MMMGSRKGDGFAFDHSVSRTSLMVQSTILLLVLVMIVVLLIVVPTYFTEQISIILYVYVCICVYEVNAS